MSSEKKKKSKEGSSSEEEERILIMREDQDPGVQDYNKHFNILPKFKLWRTAKYKKVKKGYDQLNP